MWQRLCTSGILETVHDLNKEGSHDDNQSNSTTTTSPVQSTKRHPVLLTTFDVPRVHVPVAETAWLNTRSEYTQSSHVLLGAVNRMHLEVLHPMTSISMLEPGRVYRALFFNIFCEA